MTDPSTDGAGAVADIPEGVTRIRLGIGGGVQSLLERLHFLCAFLDEDERRECLLFLDDFFGEDADEDDEEEDELPQPLSIA